MPSLHSCIIRILVKFEPAGNRRAPSRRSPIWLASVVIALWSASSCKVIDPPSGALACASTVECDAPRVCERGYCVVPPGFLPDADPSVPDADPNVPDATPPPDADPNAPDADLSCNVIALVDDFADGVASPLWAEEPNAGITLAEASGVLTLGIPALLTPPKYAGYVSATSYDMREHSFFIEIPTMLSTSSIGAAMLRVGVAGTDELLIQQKSGTITATLVIGGATTDVGATTYNATQHRWWRVVEAGGTIRVQTSANGTTWSDLGTVATPSYFSSSKISIGVRGFTVGAIPGDTVFDNANGGGVVPACP